MTAACIRAMLHGMGVIAPPDVKLSPNRPLKLQNWSNSPLWNFMEGLECRRGD